MKWCVAFSLLMLSMRLLAATFEDDLADFERDLEAEYTTVNSRKSITKSLLDMSTEELIAELQENIRPKGGKDAETIRKEVSKKFRSRLDAILQKKDEIENLLNDAVSDNDNKEIPLNDMTMLLADAVSYMKKEVHTGECVDTRHDCKELKKYCGTHYKKLLISCPKTCGYCTPCIETVGKKVCEVIKSRGQCSRSLHPKTVARVQSMCPQTCGYCSAPAPSLCSKTQHGCCWDRSTVKQNSLGTNCPKCVNRYKFACSTFKQDCNSLYKPGSFMRSFCPKACELCEGSCYDSPDHAANCPYWDKTLDWCKSKKDIMRFYCPKTCNIC